DCSRGYRPLAFLSQLLKSPITLTASALGAQTAKYVPSGSCDRCAPSLSKRWPCVPSLKRCRSKGLSSERAITARASRDPGSHGGGCAPSLAASSTRNAARTEPSRAAWWLAAIPDPPGFGAPTKRYRL